MNHSDPVIAEKDTFPREATVHGLGYKLTIKRYEDGGLNIYGYTENGKMVLDMLVNDVEAMTLEKVFADLAPGSLRATEWRLFAAIHNGSFTCLCNSSGNCVYCGEHYPEMDHAR